jgi:hypothetical protein
MGTARAGAALDATLAAPGDLQRETHGFRLVAIAAPTPPASRKLIAEPTS